MLPIRIKGEGLFKGSIVFDECPEGQTHELNAQTILYLLQMYNKMGLKAIWAGNTAYSKFLVTVGIILLSAVFFTLVSTLFCSVVFGVGLDDLPTLVNDLSNPKAIAVLKVVQTITAIGTFIIPPFVLAYLFSQEPTRFLSVHKRVNFQSAVWVILLLIVAVPFINYLGELNSQMRLPGFLKSVEDWMRESEDKTALLTKSFLEMPRLGDMLFNLFMIALIPAIGEELLFRGLVQRIFSDWSKNVHVGVWMAAFLFSAMHMQFYGFIPRFLLGGLLGYLLVWSGSLWLPVLAHFINNASAVIFTYLFQHKLSTLDADTVGTTEGDAVGVVLSGLITVGLLVLIYRTESRNRLLSGE